MNNIQLYLLANLVGNDLIDKYNLEIMDGAIEETTIIASPTVNVLKTFLDGTKVIEEFYQFNVRLNMQTLVETMNNMYLMNGIRELIEELELGLIDGKTFVETIEITTTNYVESVESSEAIMSFTIRVEYRQ